MKQFHKNGQVSWDQLQTNNVANGKCVSYYKNGNVKSEFNYVNNLEEGEQVVFDKKGNVKKVILWKLGKKIKTVKQ